MALTKLTIDSYNAMLLNDHVSVGKFYTRYKSGRVWLTKYALKCGYLDVHKVKDGIFYIEDPLGGGYWVKSYQKENIYGVRIWECFDTLSEARKYVYSWKTRDKTLEKINHNWDKEEGE